jgi:hypothetical protein
MRWRKSSSSGDTNCVELANWGAVRDSKNPTGPSLVVDAAHLVAAIKADQLGCGGMLGAGRTGSWR